VFGWPAIHTRTVEKDEAPTLKNIFIDCGCKNKEEVLKLGVHVGSVITFDNDFMTLNDRFYVGRALDNRIGGYMIAQVARLIKENANKLDYSLYIVNSVQEEIGLRGAEMIARRINPDLAIITDVCHDTHAPMYKKIEQGDQACGKGPVLTYGPAVQNNVLEMLIEVASTKEIPFQRASASRATGTDTDAFAYSNIGVASALVSLPLKYMHTTVETVHQDDVENVIRLIYEFLIQLKAGHDFRYFT
jgi:putative aminopeptidase FrvX